MNFRDLACEHVSQYKVDVLGIEEDGIFHYRGRKVPKAHILPLQERDKNILEQYRARFFASEYADIKFHQFFHHLNSSQALCINLFYPLIAENTLEYFLTFLGMSAESKISSLFEKDSDMEVAARKTSFDFFVQRENSNKIFVEVKYTEDGFGKAKNDEEHRTKFRATYLPLVEQKLQYLIPDCLDSDFFLRNYQILRNFVHIDEKDQVVLLFPKANAVVAEEARYARDYFLTDAGKERLKIVYLEEFVSFLEVQCAGNSLDGYFQGFRKKYLP